MRKSLFFAAWWVPSILLASALAAPAGAQSSAPIFPDVVSATAKPTAAGSFDFDVTVSSPYDKPERYADGFRVRNSSGAVYGERKLGHDHAGEQPFTRDLHGVQIPDSVKRVTIEARDQRSGYGGKTFEMNLPGR